jgi:hypothetical protein
MNGRVLEAHAMRGLVLAMLAVVACRDPDVVPFLWEEGFETECDGVPCGWTQTGGTEGQSRWSATSLHPGEHALVLEGAGVEIRGPAGGTDNAAFNFSTLEARAVGRCDPGASLEIMVGLAQIGFDGTTVVGLDETRPATLALPSDWSAEPTRTTMTATMALTDGGFGGTAATLQITTVVITKSGPGVCELADIVIDDVGVTDRSTGSHC